MYTNLPRFLKVLFATMSSDPWYIRILEKMGVNVTRLRWKLYQREQQLKQGVGPKGPAWWKYQHKVCHECTALNDGEARVCHSCQTKLSPMWLYKIKRVFRRSESDGPVVIPTFFVLMLLFFLFEITLGGFSLQSLMSPSRAAMVILGAFTIDIFNGPFHIFRWLAFGLLHGGLIHIGFNGYALRNIGPFIESAVGTARMLVLITVTQLGAATAAYLQYFVINNMEYVVVIGASGWLFGLIGFGIVLFHQSGQVSIRNQLIMWSGIMLVLGFVVSGISNSAHVGGMVSGMAVALLPSGGNARKPVIDRAWNIGAWICGFLWVATMVCMVISLIVNGPKYF